MANTKSEFVWNIKAQSDFDKLKTLITENIMLNHHDSLQPNYILSDASGEGIGGILFEPGKIIACGSRKHNDIKRLC